MANISVTDIPDGTTAEAADVNTNINAIVDEFNGNIDAVNLATDSVPTPKIVDEAVTDDKRPRLLHCRVSIGSAQSISDDTFEEIEWDAEQSDPEDWHDNSTNNERITVDEAGLYLIQANIQFQANTTGLRRVRFQKDGGSTNAWSNTIQRASGAETQMSLSTVMELSASGYVTVEVLQDSGGNLNVQASSTFSVTKLSN